MDDKQPAKTAMRGEDESAAVASPCVGVCRLDPVSGLCLGCQRSLDEISAWSRVSPAEQRRILAAVAERRGKGIPQ